MDREVEERGGKRGGGRGGRRGRRESDLPHQLYHFLRSAGACNRLHKEKRFS